MNLLAWRVLVFLLQDTCWLLLMLGKEQTGLAQGIFLFLFILSDHTPDSEQHHSIQVAPEGKPGSGLPEVLQLVTEGWLVYLGLGLFFF